MWSSSVSIRAAGRCTTGLAPPQAQAWSWWCYPRSAPSCRQWQRQPRPRMPLTSGSPVQPRQRRSRDFSPRRRIPPRAPEDVAGPQAGTVADEGPEAEAVSVAEAATVAEAVQAVGRPLLTQAFTTIIGRWVTCLLIFPSFLANKIFNFFVVFC